MPGPFHIYCLRGPNTLSAADRRFPLACYFGLDPGDFGAQLSGVRVQLVHAKPVQRQRLEARPGQRWFIIGKHVRLRVVSISGS